jgi:hypothetical protein
MKYSGHSDLTTIISTYAAGQLGNLYYEGGIFTHHLCPVLKIFTNEGSHVNSSFNLAALTHACECLQPGQTFNNDFLVQINETEIEGAQLLLIFSCTRML